MNKDELEKLKELALKGRLDKASKERLLQCSIEQNSPEELAKLEEEIALGELLRKLPSVPVSSNFTHRVMSAIEKEEFEPAPQPLAFFDLFLHYLVRKLVPVSLLIGLLGIGYFSYNESKNAKIASSMTELDRVAMLGEKYDGLSMEIFRDFDVIQNMNNYNSFVDTELLSALKNQ